MTHKELRTAWDSRESKQTGDTFSGIEYDCSIVCRDGCAVQLFPPESATRREIFNAKIAATYNRDVVYFYVNRVPDEWYPQDDFHAGEPIGWVEAARWIKDNHQARRVIPETGELVHEDKRGGILVDCVSAGRMVAIYDVLNEENQVKFNAMDLRVAHQFAFSYT